MKTALKWMAITIGSLITLIFMIGAAFIHLSPQFGGTVSDAQRALYTQTGHYKDGIFLN